MTKQEIALEQLRWACKAGLPRGAVLVDPAYGNDGKFRTGILRHEDDKTVELLNPDLEPDKQHIVVEKSDIKTRERGPSAMPEALIKTLSKRLAAAVEGGDAASADTEHRNLVKWIDRAVSRGALHRNAAARKKSQAARLFSRS